MGMMLDDELLKCAKVLVRKIRQKGATQMSLTVNLGTGNSVLGVATVVISNSAGLIPTVEVVSNHIRIPLEFGS